MRYRMIALDLDGTLLDANSKITERSKKAIREAVGRGVMVTIATGRMYRTSLPYVRDLDLNTDWPIITYHGALIKTTESRKTIFHRPLDNKLAAAITEEAEQNKYYVNVYIDERLYVREENEFSRYYQTIVDIELEAVGELAPFLRRRGEDPTKLTVINWDGRLDQFEAALRSGYGEKVVVLQSRPYFLEITDRRATKGQALQSLAELAGIGREEIIAFGDSHNDLDMIEYAGLGVAVANARPEVLRAADLISAANTEDGVARVIEEIVLI